MIKTIELSLLAQQNFDHILDHILKNWGTTPATKFADRFEEVCNTLAVTPKIFPLAFRKKKIRKCVVTRHNVVYYRENLTTIEIITIFDTRQDMAKLDAIISGFT